MGNLILIVLFLLIIALIVCGVVNSRKNDDDSHSSDNKLVNIIKSKKFGVLMYAIVAITLVAIFGTIFGFYFGGIIRRSSDDEFVYKPANLSNDPVQLYLPYDNTNTSGGASGNGEEAQDSSIDGTAMNGNIVNLSTEEQIAKFAGLESVWNKDDETVLKIAVGDINQNDELELYVITRNRYDEFILNTYYASPGNVWLSDNKRRLVSGVDNEPAVSTLYCYEKDDDFIVAGVFTYEYANAGTVMIERVNSRMEVLDQDHINSFASYYDIADDSIKVYLSNNNWQNPWVSDTEFDFMIMDRLVDYNPLYSYNLSFKDYSEDNIEQLMNESWAEAERASFDNIMINDLLTSYEQDGIIENGTETIDWYVLDEDGDKIMLISKYALDYKKFNDTDEAITWETSDLRKWLNDDFYNEAFDKDEQQFIYETKVENPDNHWTGVEGGNDTIDKVYLLSFDEICKYFSICWQVGGYDDEWMTIMSQNALCTPTDFVAKNNQIDLQNNFESACFENGGYSDYGFTEDAIGVTGTELWYRTPGYKDNNFIYSSSHHFNCNSSYGVGVCNDLGIRPVIWVDKSVVYGS